MLDLITTNLKYYKSEIHIENKKIFIFKIF